MQARSEETRARILRAAQESFAQHGFDATGVAEICQAAGLSKGAFYHHFASKQAVFLELLQEWLAGIEARLESFQQEAGDIPQALLQMSALVGQVFQAADRQVPLFLEFWTQSSRNPEFWRATIAPYHHFQKFYTGLIRAGIAEGSFRQIDPERAARLILALAVGFIFQGLLDPAGADWQAEIHQGLGVLLANWQESAA